MQHHSTVYMSTQKARGYQWDLVPSTCIEQDWGTSGPGGLLRPLCLALRILPHSFLATHLPQTISFTGPGPCHLYVLLSGWNDSVDCGHSSSLLGWRNLCACQTFDFHVGWDVAYPTKARAQALLCSLWLWSCPPQACKGPWKVAHEGIWPSGWKMFSTLGE